MIHVCLIDVSNRNILYPYTFEDADAFEAGERFRGLDAQAFLHERDLGGEWKAYRGPIPFEFLPATVEELFEALGSAEGEGVLA